MEPLMQFWFTWFILASCAATAYHAIKYKTCDSNEWLVTVHMVCATTLLLIQVAVAATIMSYGLEQLIKEQKEPVFVTAFYISVCFAVVNVCYFFYVKRGPIKHFIALFK
jgi:hypothetical protein